MNPNADPFTPTLLMPGASGTPKDSAELLEEYKAPTKISVRNHQSYRIKMKETDSKMSLVSPLDEIESQTRVRRQRRQRQQRRHRHAQDVRKGFQSHNKIEMPQKIFDEGRPSSIIDLEQVHDVQTPSSFTSQGTDSLQRLSMNIHDRNSNSNQVNHKTRPRRRRNKCNQNETNSIHVSVDNKPSSMHSTTNLEHRILHNGIFDAIDNDNAKKRSNKTARKQRARIKQNGTNKSHLPADNVLEPRSSFTDAQFDDTIQNQIAQVDLDLESSFPMLPSSLIVGHHGNSKKSTVTFTENGLSTNAESSWSECLINRILTTSSLDQCKVDEVDIIDDEAYVVSYNSNFPLTRLSYASKQNCCDEGVVKYGQETLDHVHDEGSTCRWWNQHERKEEPAQDTKQTSSNLETHGNVTRNLLLPNIKGKWNEAQLSKMRQRWWDAELAKRRMEEEKRGNAEVVSGHEGEVNNDSFDESSSSLSLSCCSTSSSFDTDNDIDVGMQPASLSEPFDETKSTTSNSQLVFHYSASSTISQQSPVSEQIINLEKECLQSSHPLHFIISSCYGLHRQRRIVSDDAPTNTSLDAETVLCRLLKKQDSQKVAQWKATTWDLTNFIPADENSFVLSDIPLRSADPTRLTPLQLAILLDLPRIVRILLFTTPDSEGKACGAGMEEDEFGRTPLMLACELHRLECIETLLSLTKLKLDHREQEWGNSAYHFCCLGKRSISGTKWDGEILSESAAVDAIDTLLNKTPYPSQRRILMSINNEGQNLLHLACASGNLRLVDCILQHLNSRGHSLVVKALNMKDRNRCVPFLSAVVADARDIAMHLLVSRFANRSDFSTWFAGCPLSIASSNDSVEMVRMLLEVGHPTVYDTNRALLEAVRCKANTPQDELEDDSEARCEIIRLLISSGANPHSLVATSQFPEQHLVHTDRSALNKHLKAKIRQDVVPLTVAVCFDDVEGVKTMLTSYALALPSIRSSRRSDPLLRSQPESYFQTLEKREDDVVDSSLQSALVHSLFQWCKDRRLSSATIALGLYRRGVQLSQKSVQWLANCLQAGIITPPPPTYCQAPFTVFQITFEYKPKSDLNHDVYTCSIDWSKVLSSLDWFSASINEIRCRFLWQLFECHRPPNRVKEVQGTLKEDEFYLIVENEKIMAHKSIVSMKSGKLAAAIHFNEAQREMSNDRLSVQIDLPLALAKMLLTHIYHGSIVFGLNAIPSIQCHQLLELALLAEEYLCPTLILECEMRLLKHGNRECICSHCSDSYNSKADKMRCLVQQRCHEDASACTGDSGFCKITGVYECKTTSFTDSPRSGLITPETVLDVLVVAQHMVQSSSAHNGFYGMKYFKNEGMDGASLLGAMHDEECLSAPFFAVKVAAVSVILKNFKAVINSDSYFQQIRFGHEERIDNCALDPSTMADTEESSMVLLSLCLDALKHNPFTVNDGQNRCAGMNHFCSSKLCC
ncbi:hypothetical protein ACHAWX_007222 [Stephanocyclus meneghinianus]